MKKRDISKIRFSGEQFSNTLLTYVEETTNLLTAIEASSTTDHNHFITDIEEILYDVMDLSDDIRDATEKEIERLERKQRLRDLKDSMRLVRVDGIDVKDSADDIKDVSEEEVERLEKGDE